MYGFADAPASFPSLQADTEIHTSGFVAIAAITSGSALSNDVFSLWKISVVRAPALLAEAYKSCAMSAVRGFAIIRTRSFLRTLHTF